MGKRKQQAPKHADDAKRRALHWSMGEQAGTSGSSSIIDNNAHTPSDNDIQSQRLNSSLSPRVTPAESSSPSAFAMQVDTFYQNLAVCSCTLTLNSPEAHKVKDKSNLLEFGRFRVELIAHQDTRPLPHQLPAFKECWLYLPAQETPSMLYFESEETEDRSVAKKRRKSSSRQTEFGIFWFAKLNVPVPLLTDLGNRSFWLGCENFNSQNKSMEVSVYGHNSLILHPLYPSEPVRIRAPQNAVQKLMEYFFNVQIPYCLKDLMRITVHDFFELYESVMEIQRDRLGEDKDWEGEISRVRHPCLKPRLRPYQRESVAWMLRQEEGGGNNVAKDNQYGLHPLYCEVTLPRGIKLYYNRYAGSFIRTRPEAMSPLPGGILADEMGLGKTVEVLCCMLLNPREEVDQPKELPVLVESPVRENSIELPAEAQETSAESELATENRNGTDKEGESSYAHNQDSENTAVESLVMKAVKTETDGENLQLKTKYSQNSDSALTGSRVAEQDNSVSSEDVQGPAATSRNQARLSSGCNPLLSDTGLPSARDDEEVAVLTSSASAEQDLIDSDSYIDSSNQLQPEITPQESDSFTAQLEEGMVESEESSGKLAENESFSSQESQMQEASVKVEPTSSSESWGSTLTETNLLAQQSEGGHAPDNKRKRKSRGYVEYVPVMDDSAGVSTYFSIKPASRQQWFECSCGKLESEEEFNDTRYLHTVKCIECGMSQHAECMNYDLRDPFRGDYLCPHCHAVCTTIKSGATLIISPYSICHQWIEEIRKHIKERSIKVFIYTGVSKLGYIQPHELARQDIVITTYDVLRKELDYANLPHTNSESGRRFRHPKRFLATPSPMVAVEWWRICLDEAQMVECVTTKTAEMAMRLKAVNRWCVTGTPLMRSVEDIYGLLLFLNVDPLRVHQWFRQLVWEPYCHGIQAPMHHALAQVFWRTAKKDVIDQIDLPVQTEEINWLTFSPVEDHFYRRQYEVYLRSVYGYRQKVQHLQDPSVKLHTLDRKTMNELMSPLFRLRQACCHPQIVRGEFLPLNKAMMTMEELLEHMTKKVKTECEEAHRLIVASLNGMAGLAIIKDKVTEAVEKYREVLRSVEQNKDQFRTDDLQQLHAMHNLAQLLDSKPEGVAPTLRDSQLKEQCEELKTKYMSRTKTNMAASLDGLETSQKTIKDLRMKLDSLDGDWWAEVVDMATQRSIDPDLVFKVKDDLVRTSTTEGTIADIFNTANGLLYVVDQHLQALTSARITLTDRLDQLWRDTSPGLVQAAATCCLRPADQVLKTCLFCKVDELFNEYESKLFLFVERGVTVGGEEGGLAYQVSTKRQGTWADSEVERTLKSILAFYKQNFDTDTDILEAAGAHIKFMDSLKKEFKTLRSVWLNHREMISAIDELEMATERLRLRGEFEPKPTTKILNVIEATDMFGIQASCSRDEIVGRNELRKKMGQLLYLTNLAKRAEQGDNCNPDSCPICQSGLGVEWSVLMCGHCYCLGCMRTLIDRTLIGGNIDRRLKCPMCRFFTPVREISYVTTLKKDRVTVKGSHSTKVQAVIECLIKIKQQDPSAKALVFSLWVSVLDILASALVENKITYKSLHDPNHFQSNLSAFKSDSELSVLLLPLHVGANGLNLVEANHVLLVEPELNLEEEAQAISRVYRIGQTRQTQIHRFLVRGTIEEKIYHIVKAVRESKTSTGQAGDEGVELTVGDITSLIQQPGPDELGAQDEGEVEVVAGSSNQGHGSSAGSINPGSVNSSERPGYVGGATNGVDSVERSNSVIGVTDGVGSSGGSSNVSGNISGVSSSERSSNVSRDNSRVGNSEGSRDVSGDNSGIGSSESLNNAPGVDSGMGSSGRSSNVSSVTDGIGSSEGSTNVSGDNCRVGSCESSNNAPNVDSGVDSSERSNNIDSVSCEVGSTEVATNVGGVTDRVCSSERSTNIDGVAAEVGSTEGSSNVDGITGSVGSSVDCSDGVGSIVESSHADGNSGEVGSTTGFVGGSQGVPGGGISSSCAISDSAVGTCRDGGVSSNGKGTWNVTDSARSSYDNPVEDADGGAGRIHVENCEVAGSTDDVDAVAGVTDGGGPSGDGYSDSRVAGNADIISGGSGSCGDDVPGDRDAGEYAASQDTSNAGHCIVVEANSDRNADKNHSPATHCTVESSISVGVETTAERVRTEDRPVADLSDRTSCFSQSDLSASGLLSHTGEGISSTAAPMETDSLESTVPASVSSTSNSMQSTSADEASSSGL